MKQLRLLFALSLRNPFDEVYNGQGQFYLDEKTDRGFTDTPNLGIRNLAYFKILTVWLDTMAYAQASHIFE